MATDTNNTRKLVTRKGREVTTPYTDAEALDRLRAMVQCEMSSPRRAATISGSLKALSNSNFARDLLSRRELSPDQMTWVHILVVGAETETNRSAPVTFSALRAWFDLAAGRLKTPKLAVEVGGNVLKIRRAGEQSRSPGYLHIDNGQGWESTGRRYYGKIDLQGVFHPSRDCTDDVIDTLRSIEADPAGFAADYGRRTGNCCFCNRVLETMESLAVGYGPVCADRWGLPWGEEN